MLSFMGRRPFVKEAILEAAFDCFARQGYEAVSTRQVAEAAGVGNASMFRHFASKEALGRAVYARAMLPFSRGLDAIAAEGPTPEAALAAIVELLYRSYDEHPRACALLVFPPHEFIPDELDDRKATAIRRRCADLLGIADARLAIVWGALTGALQDRFLHRRRGRMAPVAAEHARLITPLIAGVP